MSGGLARRPSLRRCDAPNGRATSTLPSIPSLHLDPLHPRIPSPSLPSSLSLPTPSSCCRPLPLSHRLSRSSGLILLALAVLARPTLRPSDSRHPQLLTTSTFACRKRCPLTPWFDAVHHCWRSLRCCSLFTRASPWNLDCFVASTHRFTRLERPLSPRFWIALYFSVPVSSVAPFAVVFLLLSFAPSPASDSLQGTPDLGVAPSIRDTPAHPHQQTGDLFT